MGVALWLRSGGSGPTRPRKSNKRDFSGMDPDQDTSERGQPRFQPSQYSQREEAVRKAAYRRKIGGQRRCANSLWRSARAKGVAMCPNYKELVKKRERIHKAYLRRKRLGQKAKLEVGKRVYAIPTTERPAKWLISGTLIGLETNCSFDRGFIKDTVGKKHCVPVSHIFHCE